MFYAAVMLSLPEDCLLEPVVANQLLAILQRGNPWLFLLVDICTHIYSVITKQAVGNLIKPRQCKLSTSNQSGGRKRKESDIFFFFSEDGGGA